MSLGITVTRHGVDPNFHLLVYEPGLKRDAGIALVAVDLQLGLSLSQWTTGKLETALI